MEQTASALPSCPRDGYNDYLQKSIVATQHFQRTLPRLPIPSLEKTCQRYLNSQQPLLASNEFKVTEAIVNKFKNNEGKDLQKELLAANKQNGLPCYLSELELDSYICDRRPVSRRATVVMSFKPDPKPEYNDQLIRATNLVVSALRYVKTYRAQLLEPTIYHRNPDRSDTLTFWKCIKMLPESLSTFGANIFGARPLDMGLYDQLFNSTRIPRPVRDEVFCESSARHLLVIRNGNYFIFDVFDTDGNILAPEEILSCLHYIVSETHTAADFPVGILTTEHRDTWTKLRQHLLELGNEAALRLIDSSVFILILEKTQTSDRHRGYYYGEGPSRWFDKSISLVCNTDGSVGLLFEHSCRDGVTVCSFVDSIYKDSTENHYVHSGTVPVSSDLKSSVRKIVFKLDRSVRESISDAKRKFIDSQTGVDLRYLDFTKFAKSYLRDRKVNPDSMVQLAIQMASYRQTGQMVSSAEMCDMSMYKDARIDWIRPCTLPVKRVCEMMVTCPDKWSPEEMRAELVSCSKAHSKLIKEAKAGQAFDRHLSALVALAEKGGGSAPPICKDPAFSALNRVALFTSNINSPSIETIYFNPAFQGGFSITYNLEMDRLGLMVAANKGEQDVKAFVENFETSMLDIREVLEGRKPVCTSQQRHRDQTDD